MSEIRKNESGQEAQLSSGVGDIVPPDKTIETTKDPLDTKPTIIYANTADEWIHSRD